MIFRQIRIISLRFDPNFAGRWRFVYSTLDGNLARKACQARPGISGHLGRRTAPRRWRTRK